MPASHDGLHEQEERVEALLRPKDLHHPQHAEDACRPHHGGVDLGVQRGAQPAEGVDDAKDQDDEVEPHPARRERTHPHVREPQRKLQEEEAAEDRVQDGERVLEAGKHRGRGRRAVWVVETIADGAANVLHLDGHHNRIQKDEEAARKLEVPVAHNPVQQAIVTCRHEGLRAEVELRQKLALVGLLGVALPGLRPLRAELLLRRGRLRRGVRHAGQLGIPVCLVEFVPG
mmetsp:Transcript_29910/g.85705  ORF Transcript_29910/g.85705 Transcript_29910/m.85705 type:complete len:230 (-) Transcript_29910:382-1071(-)